MNTHHRPVSSENRTCGFTLIELLVVIAIISLLVAILFPVFASAREKSRQIACLSNMRQISTAELMYIDNNDGILVPTDIVPTGGTLSRPQHGGVFTERADRRFLGESAPTLYQKLWGVLLPLIFGRAIGARNRRLLRTGHGGCDSAGGLAAAFGAIQFDGGDAKRLSDHLYSLPALLA